MELLERMTWLSRQTRRAPGTTTWGLRHQRRAAPPVHVTSSPALAAWGGPGRDPVGVWRVARRSPPPTGTPPRWGSGARTQRCIRRDTGLLLALYSAATVPSRLVRDYTITSVSLLHPELIISSSVRRQDTGVPYPCRSPPLICRPLQVFPGQRRGEIRATVHAYTTFCPSTLADLHERTLPHT